MLTPLRHFSGSRGGERSQTGVSMETVEIYRSWVGRRSIYDAWSGLHCFTPFDICWCFCTFVLATLQYLFIFCFDSFSLFPLLLSLYLTVLILVYTVAVLSTVRWCYTWPAACRPSEFTVVLFTVFELGILVCMRSIQTGHVRFSGETRHLEKIWRFSYLLSKKSLLGFS